MTDAHVPLPDNLQLRLRSHLDAVDRVLAGQGVSPSRRRSVRDDLNSQILDILHQRSPVAPTLPDLEAILSELDPPESYRDETVGATTAQPAPQQTVPGAPSWLNKLALVALICLPSGLVLAGLTFGLVLALSHISRTPWFEQTAPLAAWIVLGTVWSAGLILNLIVIASSSGPQGSRWRSLGSHSKIIILGLLALSAISVRSLNPFATILQDLGASSMMLVFQVPLPICLILLFTFISAVAAKDMIYSSIHSRRALNVLFASLTILLVAAYFLSLFLTLHHLATGMSNPGNP